VAFAHLLPPKGGIGLLLWKSKDWFAPLCSQSGNTLIFWKRKGWFPLGGGQAWKEHYLLPVSIV